MERLPGPSLLSAPANINAGNPLRFRACDSDITPSFFKVRIGLCVGVLSSPTRLLASKFFDWFAAIPEIPWPFKTPSFAEGLVPLKRKDAMVSLKTEALVFDRVLNSAHWHRGSCTCSP